MRPALGGLVAMLLGACSPSPSAPPIAETTGCLINVRFASDSERLDFLRRNSRSLVEQASTTEVMAGSSPTAAQVAVLSGEDCAAFEVNKAGLRFTDEVIASTEEVNRADALRRIPALLGIERAWTDSDTKACIARIAPVVVEASGTLMNALALSGLRGASVHGNTGVLYGVYDDPCDIVEEHVRAALEITSGDWPNATFCANSTLRQCGYDGGGLSVEPAN